MTSSIFREGVGTIRCDPFEWVGEGGPCFREVWDDLLVLDWLWCRCSIWDGAD